MADVLTQVASRSASLRLQIAELQKAVAGLTSEIGLLNELADHIDTDVIALQTIKDKAEDVSASLAP